LINSTGQVSRCPSHRNWRDSKTLRKNIGKTECSLTRFFDMCGIIQLYGGIRSVIEAAILDNVALE
jgi:hypothetical protein